MPGLRPTWIEIDREALASNIRQLRARTAVGAQVMSVVKADGYGHGAVQTAQIALQNGATYLGVALVEEGVELRRAGIDAPVLVLGGITEKGAEVAAEYALTLTVFDSRTVKWLARAARMAGRQVDVHIKVDSGMGRIGVRDAEELAYLAEVIELEPALHLEGVFTHFATADESDTRYLVEQNRRFLSVTEALRAHRPDVHVHAANSAASLRFPELHYDMVRMGIAQYTDMGLPGREDEGLRQAMHWITHAVHVKDIAAGEGVSYGREFVSRRSTRVMTIPVGYADGYRRRIAGRGYALVRGMRAPVIGRVCMDQAMLDVTDINGASVGDEVVLLGSQGNEFISAYEMGRWCDTIDYEVFLSPSARVPKVYIG